jgi:drug/metabolite transporter (DMT)-like permease
MGIVFAALAALGYGIGDFVGGVGGRRTDPALIPLVVQSVGIGYAVIAVVAVPIGGPTPAVLAWGAVSGIGSGVGNAALFRGLARGEMSIVSPVSAVLTAALPVLVGLAAGERLSALAWLGILLALPAIGLVSWRGAATGVRLRVTDVGYGLLSGAGFGLLFVALDQAGTGSGAWPLLPGQLVALLIVTTAALPALRVSRVRNPGWAPLLRWGMATGILGATANLLFLLATDAGALTITAVLAALYPAVTVVLAIVVLHERPTPIQLLGLAAAGVAVTAIVLG